VSFAAVTLCVASQRVFIVVSVYFVIDSIRKLLVTSSYVAHLKHEISSTFIIVTTNTDNHPLNLFLVEVMGIND
jgi:hypothetical protein